MLLADDIETPLPRPARFLGLRKPAEPDRSPAINVKR